MAREDTSGVKCDLCGTQVKAWKQLRLAAAPDTLLIRLNRFQLKGNRLRKIRHRLTFQQDLNVAPYIWEGFEGHSTRERQPHYSLRGVLMHIGEGAAGRYFSYIKITPEGDWLKADDGTVTQISPTSHGLPEVGTGDSTLGTDACLLCYDRAPPGRRGRGRKRPGGNGPGGDKKKKKTFIDYRTVP
jgi:ubiquitin C-terminal hydrolase